MNDFVEIRFNPPRAFREVKKSYFLLADGEEELQLPIASTALTTEDSPDGKVVVAAWIPRFIAEDRGLAGTASPVQGNAPGDTMGRCDWFLLGATMACVIRDGVGTESEWEAKIMARKLMEVTSDDW